MKIEVFYVPDCPHHPAALARLREILAADRVVAEIREVAIINMAMAEALRFCGSPTIRIDGRDIAGESENVGNYALSCRLYPGAIQQGVPPVEMIRRAVHEARSKENL